MIKIDIFQPFIIAICIVVKRTRKRNRIIPIEQPESVPSAPRTLLSAISTVMVINSNDFQRGSMSQSEYISDPDRSTNYHPSNIHVDYLEKNYVEINDIITREDNECVPMNTLVSECLFLDHAARRNEKEALKKRWAIATQNSTQHRTIGNASFSHGHILL